MKRFFTVFIILLILCYPFAVYFGLHHLSPRYLAVGIGFVFLLRFVLFNITSRFKITLIFVTTAGIIISIAGIISNSSLAIKLYPVVISLLMFGIFFYSILYPPTIIERFARIKTPNLPQRAIQYTKKVTMVWCGFFVGNGLIAIWTALFASVKMWAFYNGFLAYVLMGMLFVIEFIYRQYKISR